VFDPAGDAAAGDYLSTRAATDEQTQSFLLINASLHSVCGVKRTKDGREKLKISLFYMICFFFTRVLQLFQMLSAPEEQLFALEGGFKRILWSEIRPKRYQMPGSYW